MNYHAGLSMGVKIIDMASGVGELLRPENMTKAATNLARSSSLGKKVISLYDVLDSENLTPERLSRYGSDFAKRKYRSALDSVLGKTRRDGKSTSYRAKVREYIERALADDNLDAEIRKVSADWLSDLKYVDVNTGKRGKSPLGFNERRGSRSTVYIPRVGETLEGIVHVSQGVQDYIRIHELMETRDDTRPKGETEHEKMDATILDVLREMSNTSKRAGEAYKGALSVYQARSNDDPFLQGVSRFYPVREELNALNPRINRRAA